MKIFAHHFFAVVIGLASLTLSAQDSPSDSTPPRSSVQFINAASVPSLDLEIKDFHRYEKLTPGAKIFGGHFDFTTWKLKASAGMDETALVEKSLNKVANTASTVVVIGNFQWVLDENGKKKNLQAAILNFDHELVADEKPNSLTIVNGLVDKILRISINEAEFQELPPMSHKIWRGLPEGTEARALAGSKQIRLPVKFKGDLKAGIVAFYERDGAIRFAAMPQSPF